MMDKERYVLNLLEDGNFGGEPTSIGYWTGKKYYAEGVWFPGIIDNKDDTGVKIYTSRKRAENAVSKLKNTFTFVKDAEVEILN
jgi:hypothetical protein